MASLNNLISSKHQQKYKGVSQKETSSFIPVDIAHETSESFQALEKFISSKGISIEDYVEQECMVNCGALDSEQIDAVAMIVMNYEKNKRFMVIGDQTGLGKGRTLASLINFIISKGKTAVFMTEKQILFHDILWRDYHDVSTAGSDFFNPDEATWFMHPEKMYGRDGGKYRKKYSYDKIKESCKVGKKPDDVKLILTTYSQFNGQKSQKTDFFKKIAKNCVFIFDEAHNLDPGSNTFKNINSIIEKDSPFIVLSSATMGKKPAQIQFLLSLLPEQEENKVQKFQLETNPEMISFYGKKLVRESYMLKREQDLSALQFRFDNLMENEKFSASIKSKIDLFPGFMHKYLAIMRHATKYKNAPECEKEPIVMFGNRLFILGSIYEMHLSSEYVLNQIIENQKNSKKTVIACENTMESLFDQISKEENHDFQSLADVFTFEVARMLKNWVIPDDNRSELDHLISDITEYAKDNFGSIPPSIIDNLIEECNKAGIKTGEISGRTNKLVKKEGIFTLSEKEEDNYVNKEQFNAGDLDCLIVTRAGCTGISLHASPKFKDTRERVLIEWQIPKNEVERIQFFGRIFRKGQIGKSTVQTFTIGTPSSLRNTQKQNRKISRLFSFGLGMSTEEGEGMDYIYAKTADDWAKVWLDTYPYYRVNLGISKNFALDLYGVTWLERIFMRSSMLRTKDQIDILEFWDYVGQNIIYQRGMNQPDMSLIKELGNIGKFRVFKTRPSTSRLAYSTVERKRLFGDSYIAQISALPQRPGMSKALAVIEVIKNGDYVKWLDPDSKKMTWGVTCSSSVPPGRFFKFWQAALITVYQPACNTYINIPLSSFEAIGMEVKDGSTQLREYIKHEDFMILKAKPEVLMAYKNIADVGELKIIKHEACWILPQNWTVNDINKLPTPIFKPWECSHYPLVKFNVKGHIMTMDMRKNTIELDTEENINLDGKKIFDERFSFSFGRPYTSMGKTIVHFEESKKSKILFSFYYRGLMAYVQ